MMIATTYIFGIEQYDKDQTLISRLYSAMQLPEIKYEQIQVALYGEGEGEKQFSQEVLEKASVCGKGLAHTEECSKLCLVDHANHATLQTVNEKDNIGIHLAGKGHEADYLFEINDLEDGNQNADYKMTIETDKHAEAVDWMRERSINLFNEWDIDTKEHIYFIGKVEGNLDKGKRKVYEQKLMQALQGTTSECYIDDLGQSTMAYYGYTPLIEEYTRDQYGNKVNTQISFAYDELNNETQLIVAFPFYNEPF